MYLGQCHKLPDIDARTRVVSPTWISPFMKAVLALHHIFSLNSSPIGIEIGKIVKNSNKPSNLVERSWK